MAKRATGKLTTAKPDRRKLALYRDEAEHILHHAVMQKDGHQYDAQGYCHDCVAMIVGALLNAERIGRMSRK